MAFAASCGGVSEKRSDDSDDTGSSGGTSGSSGTSGSGGTNAPTGGVSGSAGTGPPGSCVYAGRVYADGESFPASDGCNSCFCEAGSVACTAVDCQPLECQ